MRVLLCIAATLAECAYAASVTTEAKPAKSPSVYESGAIVNTSSAYAVKGSFVVPHAKNTANLQIAVGFDNIYCTYGFAGGVSFGQDNGALTYSGFYEAFAFESGPTLYSQEQFAVGPGDKITVRVTALNTSTVHLHMANEQTGSVVDHSYATNPLCLNSVGWFVYNCQPNAISCGPTNNFTSVAISDLAYQTSKEGPLLSPLTFENTTLLTPLEFEYGRKRYDQAIAKFENGAVVITADQVVSV